MRDCILRRRLAWRGFVPVIALALLIGPVACSDDEPAKASGPFTSFGVAANDPARFTEPRDAVPLDNGAIAFIARSNGSTVRDPENAAEEGAASQLADRYAVFIIDAPKALARVVYEGLVAPFNIASNGRDLLYVADLGGGAGGQGAVLQIPFTGGAASPLAEGYQPQGVATDAVGKVYFTGKDVASGEPGVFVIDGGAARAVVVGGQLKSPSGLDIADDGAIYVADATAAMNLDDAQVTGGGHGVVFKVVGNAVSVVSAGFVAGYPTGIAIAKDGRIIVSSYEDRGTSSAVLLIDPLNPSQPVVYKDNLEAIFASAGLHRSRATGTMAWSGGDTVFVIQP